MKCYVENNYDLIDPDLGKSAVTVVFLWRFAEEDIDTDPTSPTFDQDGDGDPRTHGNPNFLERLIVARVRRFRFYESAISSSSVQGYFVGFVTDEPPDCPVEPCAPSPAANTVALVD